MIRKHPIALSAIALMSIVGLAQAQHADAEHNVQIQVHNDLHDGHAYRQQQIRSDDLGVKLVVEDGEATLTMNGDEVKIPSLDGDWTTYEVVGEDGQVVCVLTRSGPGAAGLSVSVPGLQMPQPPQLDIELAMPELMNRIGMVQPAQPLEPRVASNVQQPKVMLGVRLSSDAPDSIAALGFDPEQATRIVYIVPDAPADKAGLKAGDVIVSIGGSKAGNSQTITQTLSKLEPGDEIEVVIVRDEQIRKQKVTLTAFDRARFGADVNFIPRADNQEMAQHLAELERRIDEYRAKIAEAQVRIGEMDEPEQLMELSRELQGMASQITSLTRERAALMAQRDAIRGAQRGPGRWQQGEDDSDVRRFLALPPDAEGEARVLIEGREGQAPMIIEQLAPFVEGIDPEEIQALVLDELEGHMGEFEVLLNTLQEQGGVELERALGNLGEVEDVIHLSTERMERLEEQVDRLNHTNERLEQRLDRLERLLERLNDSIDN